MDIFDDVKTNKFLKRRALPNKDNIVSQGCIGKFSVDHHYIDIVDPMLLALLGRVFVTHADSVYHTNSIHYIGYSYLFDSTPEGSTPFEYAITATAEEIPEYIPEVQASKWIEEKCMLLNGIKEDKIFYARSAIENRFHGDLNLIDVKNTGIERRYVFFSMKKLVVSSSGYSAIEHIEMSSFRCSSI